MNKTVLLVLAITLLCTSILFSQTTFYVDASATGANNGSSWTDAFMDLYDGLSAAVAGDEVWVAQGTYVPAEDPFGSTTPTDSRDKTFLVPDGVAFYGSFAGTESTIGERDIPSNPTILSGDLSITGDNSDNAYHVLLVSGPTGSSNGVTIDGFIIKDGNANGTSNITVNGNIISRSYGGGMYIVTKGSSAVNRIYKNTINANVANYYAGLYLSAGDASLNTLIDNNISSNSAFFDGGGLYFNGVDASSNRLSDNDISNNTASERYGGIHMNVSDAGTNVVGNNIIDGNSASDIGGLYFVGNYASTNSFINNVISGNSAPNYSGMYLSGFFPTINNVINNTISGNTATFGSTIYLATGQFTFSNNIVWDNVVAANQIQLGAATVDINNSIIEGGWSSCNNCPGITGTGDVDPLFLNDSDLDGSDNIFRTADDGLSLKPCGPAVEAGTSASAPSEDITGYTRTGNPDIGAYEFLGDQCATYYVNHAATGLNDGTSWVDAYTDLQMALSLATWGDTIWVAMGTYFPSLDPLGNATPLDSRDKTFLINDGVQIYGGFNGTETSLGARNIFSNSTILSGDLGTLSVISDNAYHVVLAVGASGSSAGVTLDGFTITAGNANGSGTIPVNGQTIGRNNGGGIYMILTGSSAVNTIKNNTITENIASQWYGGLYLKGDDAINKVDYNSIINNSAHSSGGMLLLANNATNQVSNNIVESNSAIGWVGGMRLIINSSTNHVSHNIITGNSSSNTTGGRGGGIYIQADNSIINTVSYNKISGNTAFEYAGMTFYGENAMNELTYNTISDNSATESIGGLYFHGGSAQNNMVSNNSIFDNSARVTGGMYFYCGMTQNSTLSNNIFSGNTAEFDASLKIRGDVSTTTKIINNTIINNIANVGFVGGIQLDYGTHTINNNILWNNTGYQIYSTHGATAIVGNSIIEGGWAGCINCPGGLGDGHIDPLIVNGSDIDGPDDLHRTADDGLTVRSCSPAIDAGTTSDAPPEDITGYSRGSIPDIGAYEFQGNYHCSKYYVDSIATGANNGSSWADAFTDLQDALSLVRSGDSIWVAKGTYFPSLDPFGNATPTDPRDKTFFINDGVSLYGGFAGTESSIGARNINTNPTILHGNIGDIGIDTDNTYHVILVSGASGFSSGVTIDGFTVTGGNADGTNSIVVNGNNISRNNAGGICFFAAGSSSINDISRNTITGNSATNNYGGIYVDGSNAATITLSHNTINNNSAANDGGGAYLFGPNSINTLVIYNVIYNNSAGNDYGGLYLNGEGVQNNLVTNNTIINNAANGTGTAIGNGGGMYLYLDNAINNTVSYNIIQNNTANRYAGMYMYGRHGTNEFSHNTILGNTADTDGGGVTFSMPLAQSNIISHNTISENTAQYNGGINIGCLNAVINKVFNNTIINNSATLFDAGGINMYGDNSINEISNNTITNNSAYRWGGGLKLGTGNYIINNTIFWGNTADSGDDQIRLSTSSVVTVNNSIIEGGWTGCNNCPGAIIDGNIYPLIVDLNDIDGPDNIHRTSDDGLTIKSCSPAIDAGTTTGAPGNDITGFVRDGSPDIGAYEFQNTYACGKFFVDSMATGVNDGSSWVDAYTDLQDALASAIFGDSIWVANGTYQPSDIPPGCTGCFVNRDWTFFLKDGVRIYGGFSGTENTLNERDIPANPTILSGDIGVLGDDLDNSFHVVMAAGPAGTNIGITIDGFTIIGGNANGAGSVTINGSTCYRGAAGGVYIVKEESALNEINNNTIKSNFSILLGGGININGTKSSNKINNNLITGNSGKDGGGLRLQGGNAVNELNFNTINNNTANTAGGGLYLLGDNSTNDLNHNIISSNTANEYGGVYLKGNSGINEIIYNNINDNSSGLDWGGAYIEGENAVSTVLSENTIINNNAGRNYGGLYWDGTTASANTMNKNIIDSNSAVSNYGGLYLKIDFATTNTLTDNTLTNNSATNGSYGGAYIYSPGINNILSQNTISGNSAGSDYGGLYLVGNLAKNKFYNNTIRNNSASNDYGGVCMYGGDEDTLSHNTIIGNTAGNNYGGIFLSGSNVSNVVVNNVISGNSAVNSHGGMYFYGNFSIVPKVINNTIYGNTATNYGGLSLYNGNFTTSNNIFWGNVAAPSGSQFFANVDAYPTVNNSIIEGGWPICNNCPGTSGDGNIDPLILDITDFDGPDDLPATPDDGLSIQYYSPAINAGTITDAPSDDITGYTRDATPDIGAYENNNNQWMGTVDTNWDNPANWSMGMVPHMNQDAYISSSATHFPMIVANAYCRQLLVPDGSQITLNSGGHLQTGSHIQIGNGTSGQLTMNGGTLTAYDLILNANSTFIHNSGAINLSN